MSLTMPPGCAGSGIPCSGSQVKVPGPSRAAGVSSVLLGSWAKWEWCVGIVEVGVHSQPVAGAEVGHHREGHCCLVSGRTQGRRGPRLGQLQHLA